MDVNSVNNELAGAVGAEHVVLESLLRPTIVIDAGIASEDNVQWLRGHNHRHKDIYDALRLPHQVSKTLKTVM